MNSAMLINPMHKQNTLYVKKAMLVVASIFSCGVVAGLLTAGKLHKQACGQHYVVLTCQVIDD
jgi:hypothetical protein